MQKKKNCATGAERVKKKTTFRLWHVLSAYNPAAAC